MHYLNMKNGKKLKWFRQQNKMTQKELASILDVSTRTIRYWESEHHSIPQNFVDILNNKYNLKLTSTKKAKSKQSSSIFKQELMNVFDELENTIKKIQAILSN